MRGGAGRGRQRTPQDVHALPRERQSVLGVLRVLRRSTTTMVTFTPACHSLHRTRSYVYYYIYLQSDLDLCD